MKDSKLIKIPNKRYWDEKNEVFINIEETTLILNHSLLSVSVWESKWKKLFIETFEASTHNEDFFMMFVDYVKIMTVSLEGCKDIYNYMDEKLVTDILTYINDPMTATKIYDMAPKTGHKQPLSSEYIYGLMVCLSIPFECQEWHFNRLLTLINVTQMLQDPNKKKMTRRQTAEMYAKINQQRLAKAKKGV